MRSLVIFAVLFGVVSAAETTPPAPASNAPGPDATSSASIDTARRQLELMKTSREDMVTPQALRSGISVPEFHSTPPSVPPTRAAQPAKSETERKQANWLVDAWEKRRDGTDAKRDRQNESAGPGDTSRRDSEEKQSRISTREERREQAGPEKDAAGLNPLAGYLMQWMTPQDYALLGAQIQRTAEVERLSGTSASAATALPGATARAGGFDPASALADPKHIVAAPPENPYLQALNTLPAPPATQAAAPVISPLVTPVPAPSVYSPPAGAALPKPSAPDSLKTQSHEKYFKPLKRF